MSLPRTPKGVKLAMSFIFSRGEDFTAAVAEADGKYGPLDLVSEPFSFHFTDYYEKEMGKGLWRRMVGFEPFIAPEQLVSVKLWANRVENQTLDERGGRRVNIDPGYVAGSKFILATGKDYTHRIYLGEGIYGDLTLIFRKGNLSPLPWTYPDYASQPLIGLLEGIRKRYLWQLKNQGDKEAG